MRDIEGFCDNLPPPKRQKRNSPDRKSLKRALKNWDGFQQGLGGVEETPARIWATQTGLAGVLLWMGTRVGEWTWEEWGSSVMGHIV